MIINVIEGNVDNIMEAIEVCANYMEAKNFVETKFGTACKEREIEFPTGLNLEYSVAMPHTLEGVIKSNLCLLKNKNKIKVKQMDDPSLEIDTDLIFCMAINADEFSYVEFLGKLITMFQDVETVTKIKQFDEKRTLSLLKSELL